VAGSTDVRSAAWEESSSGSCRIQRRTSRDQTERLACWKVATAQPTARRRSEVKQTIRRRIGAAVHSRTSPDPSDRAPTHLSPVGVAPRTPDLLPATRRVVKRRRPPDAIMRGAGRLTLNHQPRKEVGRCDTRRGTNPSGTNPTPDLHLRSDDPQPRPQARPSLL